jgi:hypothetical protein
MDRTRIKLDVYVDLDPVPGEFGSAESARNVTAEVLERQLGNYKPLVSIASRNVEETDEPAINWRHNCLTDGIHDGRPEAIWNIPLLHTTYLFTPVLLQKLVVDRIYNDAMQFVGATFTHKATGQTTKLAFDKECAEKIKEAAAPMVLPTYHQKCDELEKYYRSSSFRRDIEDVVERNTEDKLNPFYEPLHTHDSLNLLCRIVGMSARYKAGQELEG